MLDPLEQLLQPSGEKSQGANRSANLFNRIQPHMSAQSPFLPSSGIDFFCKENVWNWSLNPTGWKNNAQVKLELIVGRLLSYSGAMLNMLNFGRVLSRLVCGKKSGFLLISGSHRALIQGWCKAFAAVGLSCGGLVFAGVWWWFLWQAECREDFCYTPED